MKNSYIPEVFKDKISQSIKILYGLFLLFLGIFFGIALLTFNINDNSFITSTSSSSLNFFGTIGSYSSSFIFYTFGMMGYGLVLFFFILSLFNFTHRKTNYFFIRLLGLFIGLVLIPQSLINWNIVIEFYGDSAIKSLSEKNNYDILIIAVSHKVFLDLDIDKFLHDKSVVFDVKGIFPKKLYLRL